jgi:MFS family permease
MSSNVIEASVPTRTDPRSPPCTSPTASLADWAASSTARARGSSAAPASVSATRFDVRSSSGAPSSRSSTLTAAETPDWTTCSRVAARVKLRSSATATKYWPPLPGLIIARLLTGLGVGLITATATAYLLELHAAHRPAANRDRFEVVSAAANLGGLGTGTLIAGALAQFVAAPLRTPYLVFLVLLALAAVAVTITPETAEGESRPYRPQRVRLGSGSAVPALGAFTSFAVFGLFTSLAPTFVAGTLHHPGRLLAGTISFLVFGAAAATQTMTGALSDRQRFLAGLLGEAAGLLVLAAGVHTASPALFLIGGAVAGAGAGILFKSGVSAVVATARPHERGESLAGLFLIAYLGLIGPSLGLGIATHFVAVTTAMLWFSGFLLAMLAVVAILDRSSRAWRPTN